MSAADELTTRLAAIVDGKDMGDPAQARAARVAIKQMFEQALQGEYERGKADALADLHTKFLAKVGDPKRRLCSPAVTEAIKEAVRIKPDGFTVESFERAIVAYLEDEFQYEAISAALKAKAAAHNADLDAWAATDVPSASAAGARAEKYRDQADKITATARATACTYSKQFNSADQSDT